MFRNCYAFLIAMTTNQDFDHIGNTAVFDSRGLADGFFDNRVNTKIQR